MKTYFLIAVLVGLLIASSLWALDVWQSVGEVEMVGHGIIAMVLGIIATIGVGGGLMFLVFYSHRKGYDDLDAGP